MKKTLIFIAIVLAIIRAFIPPGSHSLLIESYKDVSHFFIGGIFFLWRIKKEVWQKKLFWSLSGWEVAMATWSHLIWPFLVLQFASR